MKRILYCAALLCVVCTSLFAGDGNRLTYLDELNPYYPHKDFPKLITPQWVGEDGVDCVVVLAIDDMRDTKKYEEYLRPILIRLKQIDGRAPVSIMTCKVDPKEEQLQQWLSEGLSIEIHTVDHPCPLLYDNDFAKAKSTYDRCVDLMNQIPNNKPVAFRMPCCDSLNTVSPRFYAEIFNKTTENGNHLAISSSVFNIFTSDDPEIPRELVLDADGNERFKKLIPRNLNRGKAVFNKFVNTIENYPYPYVIGNKCWEFPCVTPSDWSAQHYRGKNDPQTLEDFKAALDITVHKKGVFNLVFHPHGWIRNDQIVELIDHAVKKHGKKVKFLTFKEAQERLNKNLLSGQSIRHNAGYDTGVRMIDLNNDGFLDVMRQAPQTYTGQKEDRVTIDQIYTRLWNAEEKSWLAEKVWSGNFFDKDDKVRQSSSALFGITPGDYVSMVIGGYTSNPEISSGISLKSRFRNGEWEEHPGAFNTIGPLSDRLLIYGSENGRDYGVRYRNIDADGSVELIAARPDWKRVYKWHLKTQEWMQLPFALPADALLVDKNGTDAGLRFVDINEDGFDDVVFSNHERYGIWLFKDMKTGWSIEILSGKRGDKKFQEELPEITRKDGSNNGFFVHSRHLFWQNEDTAELPDLVDRRSFDDLLKGVKPSAKSPEMSLRSIKVRKGFKVELVAAEPLVKDPVAFEWGADGKLWVAEMADYPVGCENGGRIRVLEDTTGDGKYDKSTLFLDQLNFPNGVIPWKKGVLITAAPDILYAEDTDGDGKADVKKILFTGFGQGNQQHRANGLVYGLDNWVYCANGDSGGQIKSIKAGKVTNISGRDFRINPETSELDLQTGSTQFGRNRDNWGNWFGNNNSNPMYHFVLADHYLRRNRFTRFPDARNHISVVPGASLCYPISKSLERFNDYNKLNRFTSACSAMINRDDFLGPEMVGNSFVSEPVHNLVHREVVLSDGVTFTSRRADDERQSEFLASSDNWFRPTMLKTGPDGALYIADMYRQVIEHPQYIPKELQAGWDLRAGEEMGRIYRVTHTGENLRKTSRLDQLTTAQLVSALETASSWQRDTVQRLLVHRGDLAAVLLLEKVSLENESPLTRLHALCTLDGLNALKKETVLHALRDPHPGVRRNAIRLSEPFLNTAPGLGKELLSLVKDSDPQVQMQLAYSLGAWNDQQAGAALGELLVRTAGDRYLSAAALSSINRENVSAVLSTVLKQSGNSQAERRLVGQLLGLAARLGSEKGLLTVFSTLTAATDKDKIAQRFTPLAEVLDALNRRKQTLKQLRENADTKLKAELDRVPEVFAMARSIMQDKSAQLSDRIAAIRLLGRQPEHLKDDLKSLFDLLIPQNSGVLQSEAVQRLGELNDLLIPEQLMSRWKTFGPSLRSQVLDILISRAEWTKSLMDSLAKGIIAPTEIDAARREQLARHRNPEIRTLAEKLLAGAIDSNRRKILNDYQSALTLTSDPVHGKQVFTKSCGTCHKVAGAGHEVGPDLAALKDKSPESLLVAVLDPNRNVESKYVSYIAVTEEGRSYTGLLAGETGNSITLLAPEGKRQTILRSDLEELRSTSKSTMPEGLEKDLQPQDLADVMAYVASTGTTVRPNGRFPRTIRPQSNGTLKLSADSCELYGPTLVLENTHNNLGYWGSADDRAIWPIHVPEEADYAVQLRWACDETNGGNTVLVRCGTQRLTSRIESTGSWETYREATVGTIHLPQGSQRLEIRSEGKLNGYLFDLKSVRLIPKQKSGK